VDVHRRHPLLVAADVVAALIVIGIVAVFYVRSKNGG